jgi:hypothetical protein
LGSQPSNLIVYAAAVVEPYQVFLSYSRNDLEAATNLLSQLEQAGLSCFRDQDSIREGDNWLQALQQAVDSCGSFVLLVGQDGVRRWMAAETEVALQRHIDPHDDSDRLPIFTVLLDDVAPGDLIAFLRSFQATRWNGSDALPQRLIEQIRSGTPATPNRTPFEGCPFVGLHAFQPNQAHLFFGRRKETLDALTCFDTRTPGKPVRWLQIQGNSGSGKSSLMNAGMLPLIEQGWLFTRTGIADWKVIGPMMPGQHPLDMLAEQLARSFSTSDQTVEMSDVRQRLQADERGLSDWLRSRKQTDTAFLLAIDQFEELFTLADPAERQSFDEQLASALLDPECPLFVLSTVRADFLDQYDHELPLLQSVLNRFGRAWSLPPVGVSGLGEIIEGPAELAGLDIDQVKTAIVAEAKNEPGALPLVENALAWLWEQRKDGRLSGQLFNDSGGLSGILSRNADSLLDSLAKRKPQALELLFNLVRVDPEGRQHTRRQLPLDKAIEIAGGGGTGRSLVDSLAGRRDSDGRTRNGPVRLITLVDDRVNLIHETLVRTKGIDDKGQPLPYWRTLWDYVDKHKDRAAIARRLEERQAGWARRSWIGRVTDAASLRELRQYRGLPSTADQRRFLRFSGRVLTAKGLLLTSFLALAIGSAIGLRLLGKHDLPNAYLPYLWAHWLGHPPLPELVSLREAKCDGETEPACRLGVDGIDESIAIGKYEVTFREYDFFVLATGRKQQGTDEPAFPKHEGWGRDSRPAIHVSWTDAYDYTQWLSEHWKDHGRACRLPTDQEWQYAAQAETGKEYGIPAPNGSDEIAGKGLANCDGCGGEWDGKDRTAPVGEFDPNAWGLHDMHGNVWEWCLNEYEDPDRIAPSGKAPRALRGGSWRSGPLSARASSRFRNYPVFGDLNIGFRVMCSSPMPR